MASFDWGNVGAGAAAGWGLGSFGGPVGMGAGALLGGIAGLFGGGGDEGAPPTAEVLYREQYPWRQSDIQGLSGLANRQIGRTERGLAPQWWENLRPQVTEQAMGDLSQAYLGRSGAVGPGILDYQKSFDVSRGLGRGAGATAGMESQLDQWGQKAKDISTYIAGLTGQYTQRASEFYPQFLSGLPEGPSPVGIANFPGRAPQPSQFQQVAGMIGSMTPWMSGMMGGFGTATDTTGVSQPWDALTGGTGTSTADQFPQGFAGVGTGGANLMGGPGGGMPPGGYGPGGFNINPNVELGYAPGYTPPATVSNISGSRGGAGQFFGDVGQGIADYDWGQKLFNAPWTNVGSNMVNWWMGY
ncbi:hypothetical protein LCGC14_1732500 [marine sediment metagenome]|uniref:Uncharacterized protein n=1 Tax=marine sediment metagenome TaxID=412755 RepID=A0A0F9H8X2_9ZZZZ